MHFEDERAHGYGGHGFSILAALHGGGLELSCRACAADPQLKSMSGCEEPTQEPVWVDGEDEYYSCPVLFVPETVSEWYEEYAYATEFGTTIDFKDRPARWLEAMKIYRTCYNTWVEERLSKQRQQSKVARSTAYGQRHQD